MMVRVVVLVCFGLLSVVNVAVAQPPPPPPAPPVNPMGDIQEPESPTTGTGAISGVVTDGATGLPLAGAYVLLTNQSGTGVGAPRPRQTTDSRGRYVFTHLPASQNYFLVASRPGYLDGGYKRLPGTTTQTRIGLADAQWFTGGDIAMWKPASISGVVRDERGEPLVDIPVRVLMRVRAAAVDRWAAGPVVSTDDLGAYRISGLQPGAYVVHVPNIQVTLPSGEVALYSTPPRPTVAGAPPPASTVQPPDILRGPDGLGLLVGHYPTAMPDDQGSAYRMAFHPAADTVTMAEVINVGHGDQRTDVDVAVRPGPTVTVSGRVVGPVDAIVGLPVRLVPVGHESLGPVGEAGITRTDATGAFTFSRVPAGDYSVIASRSQSGFQLQGASLAGGRLTPRAADPFVGRMSNNQFAGVPGVMFHTRGAQGVDATGSVQVSVGTRAITDLTIPLTPTVTVSGYFEWDGSETPPFGLSNTPAVRLEPADANPALGSYFGGLGPPPKGDSPSRIEFTLPNVLPGRYLVGDVLASTWALAGAEWNGRDVMASALEVTGDRNITGLVIKMMGQRSGISGHVKGVAGEPAADALAVSFPVAPAEWLLQGISAQRFRNAAVATDGSYRLVGVLPGDYYVAAIPLTDRTRWLDPAYLATLAAQATRVSVKPSATSTQDLRLVGGAR